MHFQTSLSMFQTHLESMVLQEKGFFIITARADCSYTILKISPLINSSACFQSSVYLCLCGTGPTFPKYILSYFCYCYFTDIFFQGTSFVSTEIAPTSFVVPVFSGDTKGSCYLPCPVSVPLLGILDLVCCRTNTFPNQAPNLAALGGIV